MIPALVLLNFILAVAHIPSSHGIPHTSMNLRVNQKFLLDKKEPEICKPSDATDETLWMAMPAWNETSALKRCIESISSQVNTGFQNILIVVFDPLAVLLLIAANFSLKHRYGWDFETVGQKPITTPVDKPKPAGLKVGTAVISSKKKDPEVVYKDRIVEVESTVNVDTPADVKDLETKVQQKLKEKNDD